MHDRGGAAALALSAALLACGDAVAQQAPKPEDAFLGIRLELKETAHDGRFDLSPIDSPQRVDVGSELRLRFIPPEVDVRLASDKRWQGLSNAISELAALQRRHAALLEQAAKLGPGRDPNFTSAAQSYNTALVGLLTRMTDANAGPVLTRQRLNEIMIEAGRANGNPWELLVRELNALRQRMMDDVKTKAVPAYFVVVRAYRIPPKADPVRLHVENYDNIVNRPIAPPSGFGLPSARELEQIQAELAGAKLAAGALNEVAGSKDEIRQKLREFLDATRKTLKERADSYKALADQLEGKDAEEVLAELRKMNVTEVDRISARILAIRTELRNTEKIIQPIADRIVPLRGNLGGADLNDLVALFQAINGLQADLPRIKTQVQTLGKTVAGFPADFEAVMKQAEARMTDKAKQDVRKLREELGKSVADFRADLFAGLPQTAALIDTLSRQLADFAGARNATVAIDSLPTSDVTPRRLTDLVDAVVDLGRTEVSPGDKLELQVAFVGAKDGLPDLGTVEKKVTYNARLTNTGLHRRFSGDLIFAKAVRGEGSDVFKPNVAVSMEWHYFDRKNRDGWWNKLDPGFGLHAANLDQNSDQAVELGAGINASIFGGLLRFAYGYNFGVKQDRAYYWIGFGLFGALNRLQAPSYDPAPQRASSQ